LHHAAAWLGFKNGTNFKELAIAKFKGEMCLCLMKSQVEDSSDPWDVPSGYSPGLGRFPSASFMISAGDGSAQKTYRDLGCVSA